jgi:site-specific DNA recombinase
VRCAIYTRKSTEEGLEQEFNSLDAQRESAEAFIRSQRREGWVVVPELYDDGGFTGANMERPALARLLAAIEAEEVDCVVVYKVDRLSRSLLDFTRMLSTFEKHRVSFVAVTQQFNTSTSLGRLTLNILLSFAQFERDLVGERTRDKMSAARRKGKWVGGCPVLGYDVEPNGGRLVVNAEEADQVRAIFALFEKHGSLRVTLEEMERHGWRLKSWIRRSGVLREGGRFGASSLRRLLSNALYAGRVRHQGVDYAGEHAAILEPQAWDRVQHLLGQQAAPSRGLARIKHEALLSGLLCCEPCGARMVYAYGTGKDRRYPYYVCVNAQRKGRAACAGRSLQAHRIEQSVLRQLEQTQPALALRLAGGEPFDRRLQAEVLRGAVERIGYDGRTGKVSIRVRTSANVLQDEAAAGTAR